MMRFAFRSALPHGERPVAAGGLMDAGRVSIRAPARGATIGRSVTVLRRACFDPRSRTGSDIRLDQNAERAPGVSIRAPARGATRPPPWSRICHASFDPRSRTGSDIAAARTMFRAWVSIRAPARGATSAWRERAIVLRVSIRAPARGATSAAALSKLLRQ